MLDRILRAIYYRVVQEALDHFCIFHSRACKVSQFVTIRYVSMSGDLAGGRQVLFPQPECDTC